MRNHKLMLPAALVTILLNTGVTFAAAQPIITIDPALSTTEPTQDNEPTESTEPTVSPTATTALTAELDLVVGSLLPLATPAGQAELAAVELALGDIRSYLSDGSTVKHLRQNLPADTDAATAITKLNTLITAGAEVIVTSTNAELYLTLVPVAKAAGVALVTAQSISNQLGNYAKAVLASTAAKPSDLAKAFFDLAVPAEAVDSNPIALVYLPDSTGNAINRALTKQSADRSARLKAQLDESDEKNKPDTEAAAQPDFSYTPIALNYNLVPDASLLADNFVTNLVTPLGYLAVYIPDQDASYLTTFLNKLYQSQKVTPNQVVLISTNHDALTAAEFDPSGVRTLQYISSVPSAFSSRLQQLDPWVAATPDAVKSYDAVLSAALAKLLANSPAADNGSPALDNSPADANLRENTTGSDNSDRTDAKTNKIIANFSKVTAGTISCSTFGECAHILATRSDISYLGVAGSLAGSHHPDNPVATVLLAEIQPDNSLTVLNSLVASN